MKFAKILSLAAFATVLMSCEKARDGEYEVTVTETRPLTSLDEGRKLDATAAERFFDKKPSPYVGEHPDYWIEVAPRQFETMAFQINGARLTVSEARGGLLMNINRWYGQFGKEAITAEQMQQMPRIVLGGHEAILVETVGIFTGRDGRPIEGQALLGAIAPVQDSLLVVKMTGAESTVSSEKSNFQEFCRTLRGRQQLPESQDSTDNVTGEES